MKTTASDDWVRAWKSVVPAGAKGDDRYRTSRELQKAMGIAADKTLQMLHDLHDAGRLTTKRVKRPVLGGNVMALQAYALREKP